MIQRYLVYWDPCEVDGGAIGFQPRDTGRVCLYEDAAALEARLARLEAAARPFEISQPPSWMEDDEYYDGCIHAGDFRSLKAALEDKPKEASE